MTRIAAILALSTLLSGTAAAETRPAYAACDRQKLAGRAFIECLEAALRRSDQAVLDAVARAQAKIEARSDLVPTQRTRWKNTLEEAHGLFVRFRNFDCQNVAPYEGSGGRIGAFEERLACLIDKNTFRLRDLDARYSE